MVGGEQQIVPGLAAAAAAAASSCSAYLLGRADVLQADLDCYWN